MIIIGAGAAGLMAAITSARAGIHVLLLEQNSKIGKKILVSGNGKCNIDNKIHSSQSFSFTKSSVYRRSFRRL